MSDRQQNTTQNVEKEEASSTTPQPVVSTLATSVTVILLGVVVAIIFAAIRLPYMGSDEHFMVVGPRRPVVNSIMHSLSVQVLMGPSNVHPISLSMQIVFIVQTIIAFFLASALFMALASHLDSVLARAAV
jgi:hypothetical protein